MTSSKCATPNAVKTLAVCSVSRLAPNAFEVDPFPVGVSVSHGADEVGTDTAPLRVIGEWREIVDRLGRKRRGFEREIHLSTTVQGLVDASAGARSTGPRLRE